MGNCASIALFLCSRIPRRYFKYYRNNMYTVINVITIIKHQLRCVGQVFSYFSFIVWVHVISPFKSYPITFGTFLGHIYSLSSLYKPGVASSQASVPLWCFILGPLVRVCLLFVYAPTARVFELQGWDS